MARRLARTRAARAVLPRAAALAEFEALDEGLGMSVFRRNHRLGGDARCRNYCNQQFGGRETAEKMR